MNENVNGTHDRRHWPQSLGWGLGAFVVSAVLGTACIVLGAVVAMALEVGVPTPLGIAINAAGAALMVVAYTTLLVAGLRYVGRRRPIPQTVWLGLAAFPLLWMAAMAATPGDALQGTPVVVNGVGAAIAWWFVGRARPAAEEGVAR